MGASPDRQIVVPSSDEVHVPVANGDGLVRVAGQVFVKTDDGVVVRVDPWSARITGQVRVDTTSGTSRYCQGIGTDGPSVWACSTGAASTGLVRLDPKTLRVTARVPLDKVFDQLSLPHNARGLWVLVDGGRSVAVVSPATRAVATYPLGSRCLQLAASDTRVAVTCATDDRVRVLDSATGRAVGEARLSSPRLATFLGDDLWVDTSRGLTRLGKDLSTRAVYPQLVPGLGGDVTTYGGALWVREPGGPISQIDPDSGSVRQRYVPGTSLSAGSLLVTDDHLWTTASDDGFVARLTRR